MSSPRKGKGSKFATKVSSPQPQSNESFASATSSGSKKKKESEAERKKRIEELKRNLNIPSSAYQPSSNSNVRHQNVPANPPTRASRVKAQTSNSTSAAASNMQPSAGATAKPNSASQKAPNKKLPPSRAPAANFTGKIVRAVSSDDDDDDDHDDSEQSDDEEAESTPVFSNHPTKGSKQANVTSDLNLSSVRKRKHPSSPSDAAAARTSSIFSPLPAANVKPTNANAGRSLLKAKRSMSPAQPAPNQQQRTATLPAAPASSSSNNSTSKFILPKAKPIGQMASTPADKSTFTTTTKKGGTQIIGVDEVRRMEATRRPIGGSHGIDQESPVSFSFGSFRVPKRSKPDALISNAPGESASKATQEGSGDSEMDTTDISDMEDGIALSPSSASLPISNAAHQHATSVKPHPPNTGSSATRRFICIVPDTNALMNDCQLFDRIFDAIERAERGRCAASNSNSSTVAPLSGAMGPIEVNAAAAEFRFIVPWAVIQELDKLKRDSPNGSAATTSESAIAKLENSARAYKARQAIRLLNSALLRGCVLRGQSATEKDAAASAFRLESGTCNNDDRILQCCLQARAAHSVDRQCSVYLFTYDLNLANKALISTIGCVDRHSVRALLREGFTSEMSRAFASTAPPSLPVPTVTTVTAPAQRPQPAAAPVASASANAVKSLYPNLGALKSVEVEREQQDSVLASELLRLFSSALETEMLAEYADWWLEVVLIRPPWHSLLDLLICFNKHWIAVFSRVFGRANAAAFADIYKHAKALRLADNVQLVTSLRQNNQMGSLQQVVNALAGRLSKPYATQANAVLRLITVNSESAASANTGPTVAATSTTVPKQVKMDEKPHDQLPPAEQEDSAALKSVLSCLETLWQHIQNEQTAAMSAAGAGSTREKADTRAQLGSIYTFLRTLLDVLTFWRTLDASDPRVCDNTNVARSFIVFVDLIRSVCLDEPTASHFSFNSVREFALSRRYVNEALEAFGTLFHQLQSLFSRSNYAIDSTDLDMDIGSIDAR